MNTTRISAIHNSVKISVCSSDQYLPGDSPLPLPNRLRQAWVSADTGFQFATHLRTAGNLFVGTKVFAMNVNGKITTNDALFNTSTLGTITPTKAMIHEIAYANRSSSRYPPIASSTD